MTDNDVLTMFIRDKALLEEVVKLYCEESSHDEKSNNIGDVIIAAMDKCKPEKVILCYHERKYQDCDTLQKFCVDCGDEL